MFVNSPKKIVEIVRKASSSISFLNSGLFIALRVSVSTKGIENTKTKNEGTTRPDNRIGKSTYAAQNVA